MTEKKEPSSRPLALADRGRFLLHLSSTPGELSSGNGGN